MATTENIRLKYPHAYIVEKIWGDGLKRIVFGFNEHRRIGRVYIVNVDSKTVTYDMHDLAEDIENHLCEEYGAFDRHEDFDEFCEYNSFDISNCPPSCDCNIHNETYQEWFENQFPSVDISGGSSNWYEI